MIESAFPLLGLLIFLAAVLYSSVGHAGASGYLAAMALLSIEPEVMRPTALVLNIMVACIATWRFARSGFFAWNLFWPFALASIPFAMIGGAFTLPTNHFKSLIGIILIISALRLLLAAVPREEALRRASPAASLSVGALLGLLAGLTGTGGGIFLSPLLLFMRWATAKSVAAVSAAFILVNSAAGLIGFASQGGQIPNSVWPLGASAVAGGLIGSYLGSTRLENRSLRRLLGVVLILAGTKLLST